MKCNSDFLLINKGDSALLESPTGTGKTLSLLCTVLGWREHLKNNLQKSDKSLPTIIYATRTHSQLNQCVQELKATAYNPIMSILGSREQLCVHEKVSLHKGSLQNAKCRSMNISSMPCTYKLGTTNMKKNMKTVLSTHILDVEDLHLIGRNHKFCPYYFNIENCKKADIIFMPYNYLIDENIRPTSVNIKNSIIIFDEAHNIQSVCCDSKSFDLRMGTLDQCIAEIQQVMKHHNSNSLISIEDLNDLNDKIMNLEMVIKNIPIARNSANELSSIFQGSHIFEILRKATITKKDKDTIIDMAQDILRELASGEAQKNLSLGRYGLEIFIKALQTIFDPKFDCDSFRVHLCIKKKIDTEERCLSLWCFNPGLAIEEINNKCHCMILTSGTLSPLQSFASELKMSFPIQLENTHLIKPDQIFVSILQSGPCSKTLSSEYAVRKTPEYMKELGNTLINISRRVPYGILVFFASYAHMSDCVKFWYESRLNDLSIMEQLERNKHIVIEPRVGGQIAVKAAFKEYSAALNDTGAMMFAVMRGKISEGMDFRDNFARCVIICGIPYPYAKDPKILEKKNFLDKQLWLYNKETHSADKPGFGCISGALWYKQQATRAVNQAIGRGIRHKNDYSAIILADRRYKWKNNQQHLSSWIKPHIQETKNFGLVCLFIKSNSYHIYKKIYMKYKQLMRDMTRFFKSTTKYNQFIKKPKITKKSNTSTKIKKELFDISKLSKRYHNDHGRSKRFIDFEVESTIPKKRKLNK